MFFRGGRTGWAVSFVREAVVTFYLYAPVKVAFVFIFSNAQHCTQTCSFLKGPCHEIFDHFYGFKDSIWAYLNHVLCIYFTKYTKP